VANEALATAMVTINVGSDAPPPPTAQCGGGLGTALLVVAMCGGPYLRRAEVAPLNQHLDDLIPLAQGGPEYRLSNLQALCPVCHSLKSAREVKGRRR
jgi:hypothetical protein